MLKFTIFDNVLEKKDVNVHIYTQPLSAINYMLFQNHIILSTINAEQK